MKTITAKELRTNLDGVIEEVLHGKSIVVKHRFKDPIQLTAYRPTPRKPNNSTTTPGLAAFDNAVKKPHTFDSNKSIKQLYHESLNKKYEK